MNRASLSSSSNPDACSIDFPRRARSYRSSHYSSVRDGRASRASVLPSAVLPYLRRLDIGDEMAAVHKPPLLTLKLSSPSFLDSEVKDDVSLAPLYVISTRGTYTTVFRSDPWNGQIKTADIEWPLVVPSKGKGKDTDGVIVQMGTGRRKPADAFLRPGSILSAPRKFKIPGYSHALKWKAVGSSYYCLATSAKGPIAVLEPAVESVPPRLKVFETLHDKYDVRPMLEHHGVSILLLDYILVSALLLLTDVQEWMVVQKYDGETSTINPPGEHGTNTNGSLNSAPPTSTSASQWRKIIYGEPLFPKRASSVSAHASTSRNAMTCSKMSKIVYGDSIYPTLRTPSPDDSSLSDSESDSEPETEAEEAVGVPVKQSPLPSRAPSPSAESVCYPLTPASAPSHTYLDPLFYNDYERPPVPPLPMQYSSSGSSRGASPSLPSASLRSPSTSRRPRELPRPPQSSSPRSRSSPPRPRTADGSVISSPVDSVASSFSPDRRSVDSVISRQDTVISRTLPRPPASESSRHPSLRHSQSSTRLLNGREREKWTNQYTQRTLPPTPVSVSNPEWQTALRIRKRSHNDLPQWFPSDHDHGPSSHVRGHSIYDVDSPPPAYNTIDFASGLDMTLASSSPPPPPLPPHL